jgi:hypothetical protein
MRHSRCRLRRLICLMVTALLALPCLAALIGSGSPSPASLTLSGTGVAKRYGASPLAFEENAGQADAGVRFVAHGKGYILSLGPDALTFALGGGAHPAREQASPDAQSAALRFAFAGANPAPALAAEGRLAGVANYLVGNDPSRWHRNVPTSARVRYTALYPGIDLTVYGAGEGGGVEYDAIVAPHADPAAFALAIAGAGTTVIDHGTGDLVLTTTAGTVRQRAPVAYQERDGGRVPVDAGYDLRGDGTVGFRVGPYDPALSLVIDPQVTPVYGTVFGGSGNEEGSSIVVDGAGNAYITGSTHSPTFPVTDGSTYGGGNGNAFVTKLDANGARVYSTYLGGSHGDGGRGVAVDGAGNVYVAGFTDSADFPVTDGSAFGGPEDAFVAKLDGNGARVYSGYLGGKGQDFAAAIAVDGAGVAYITGFAQSSDFPVTDGSTYGGGSGDAFVAKFDASGVRIFSTYLGGRASDSGIGIAVDAGGNAYITGSTYSGDFPSTDGSTYDGSSYDAIVVKLDANGARVYSTYLGGSRGDSGDGIAVDGAGNVYVTGYTASADFPVTDGSAFGGREDAFVAKLDGNGARVYSAYLGGRGNDRSNGIAVDASGNAYVTGSTDSADFPVTNGTTYDGGLAYYAAFVTKLDGNGVRMYSTYLGGNTTAVGDGIAVDAGGNAYVTGNTTSTNFPVTDHSILGGSADAFVTKLDTSGVSA